MGDRTTAHVKSLQASCHARYHICMRAEPSTEQSIDWDQPKQGGSVNDYMELLVKETVTLHKVLSRYLTATVVEVRNA